MKQQNPVAGVIDRSSIAGINCDLNPTHPRLIPALLQSSQRQMQSSLATTARRILSLTDTKNAIPHMPNGMAKKQTCLYTARVMSSRCPEDATVQFDLNVHTMLFTKISTVASRLTARSGGRE